MPYKRKRFDDIKRQIIETRSKIQVIVGPRQVGKTTLIDQIIQECEIPHDFYSADDVSNANRQWLSEIWETQRLKMDNRKETRRLLVIDEVQKIDNWSETVKAEWDIDTRANRQLSVVLLGSSRLLIQKGLTESLAGRFELIRLTHWGFDEMRDCFGFSLQQYIYYGGYPGAAQYINDERRWRNYVKDSLIEPTISKDVLLNTNIVKPQLLRQLFEIGSSYSGELLSLTKIASQLTDAGNVTTLASYLNLLQQCELLGGLQKFAFANTRKYNSVPKFQVFNNALRNVYADVEFGDVVENPREWGRFEESAVGAYLISQSTSYDYTLYYWREKDNEVDYVLARRSKLVAIEVKTGRRTTNEGLPIFKQTFKPHRAFIVGSGGLSVEELLTMDLEVLFR